ncbi:guanylate kinase isoform X2 [Patella vulgata]|uniref:guanylate kinase isoform X1 n=2 Tax=Patella vulgata TaxID=6465 RepID=UPI0024A957C0|nr:guanylate kinase isoform X1 [Patella vulgata]XP_055959102.1 guanylate kinase isoform X2 [Patella vulgata]
MKLSSCLLCWHSSSSIHNIVAPAVSKIFLRKMSSNCRAAVISGPSGGGKSTLLTKLMGEYPNSFAFSVSHTTRKPRPGESDGKDYHFVQKEKFGEMISNQEFLEHAEFSGNMYGTSKKSVNDIQKSGKICILEVEITGVKSIKKSDLQPTPRYIFIKPPSLDILKSRLEGRGTETPESLQKRLDTAAEALDYAGKDGVYDYIIINDSLEDAYKIFKNIFKQDLKSLQ